VRCLPVFLPLLIVSKPRVHILVIRLSSLGDVVLATPVARLLSTTFPDAELHVAVAGEFADVWRSNPYVARLVTVDRRLSARAMADAVRDQLLPRYDVVVDLQRNIRSYALRRGRAMRLLRSSKHRAEKLALVWLKRSPAQSIHVAQRFIAALKPLGIGDDGMGLEFWLPEERGALSYPPRRRVALSDQVLSIAPGARHATKQWIPERFAAVARVFQERGWQIVLFGSEAERPLCEQIARTLDPERTIIFAGLPLVESVRVLDRCQAIVSNDSAMVHIAAARGVPVVAIYGSTVPELGFTPYRVRHHIVETELGCRPCTHIGRARCPLGHFGCMVGVTVGDVVHAVRHITES
jgi:heptosyltransferase-2